MEREEIKIGSMTLKEVRCGGGKGKEGERGRGSKNHWHIRIEAGWQGKLPSDSTKTKTKTTSHVEINREFVSV